MQMRLRPLECLSRFIALANYASSKIRVFYEPAAFLVSHLQGDALSQMLHETDPSEDYNLQLSNALLAIRMGIKSELQDPPSPQANGPNVSSLEWLSFLESFGSREPQGPRHITSDV